MRRLSGRINWRTSLCLQSLMAVYCLCIEGEGGRKKCPVQHRTKVWACDAQRTRLNLQRCARLLSVLILSVSTVPVCPFVLSDQAFSICYIFFPIWESVNYSCLPKADITCDDLAVECTRVKSALVCQWHKLSCHYNFPAASCHISTVLSILLAGVSLFFLEQFFSMFVRLQKKLWTL